MSSLDSQQVTLALTKTKFIIDELRRKGRFARNRAGDEVFRIQFDSRTFEFLVPTKERPNVTHITVGKSAADCLILDSCVICGPSIDGQVWPALEAVREFDVSLGERENPNTCSYCNKPFEDARALADHIIDAHATPEPDDKTKRKEAVA